VRGGLGGKHTVKCVAIEKLGTPHRSGVTELPGLTSDPIYTADRRGGILISFGPIRRPDRVLNPSSWPQFDPGAAGSSPAEPRLHSYRNALLYLRASDHVRSDLCRVVCGCNSTQYFPLYEGIEPARTAGSSGVCSRHPGAVAPGAAVVRRARARTAIAFNFEGGDLLKRNEGVAATSCGLTIQYM